MKLFISFFFIKALLLMYIDRGQDLHMLQFLYMYIFIELQYHYNIPFHICDCPRYVNEERHYYLNMYIYVYTEMHQTRPTHTCPPTHTFSHPQICTNPSSYPYTNTPTTTEIYTFIKIALNERKQDCL